MLDDARLVTAGVLVEGGRLFLARRPFGDRLSGYWELPGGKLEQGETPQECLERELREELGMDARIGDQLAETVYEYEHGRFRMVAFQTKRLSGFELRAHDKAAWVNSSEISQYTLAPADVDLIDQLLQHGHWR